MIKLEYIWIDGAEPTSQLRSKTKIVENFTHELSDCPLWGFDGSSTNQAPGDNSDCVLKPVRMYENPLEENSYLILCEVWLPDGNSHPSNFRIKLDDIQYKHSEENIWVGIEQEYTLYEDGRPLGWYAGSRVWYERSLV